MMAVAGFRIQMVYYHFNQEEMCEPPALKYSVILSYIYIECALENVFFLSF